MSQDYLGEFEQMVLLSILRMGESAYGLSIKSEMESVAGRSPSSGALYTTLDRLERKGLIESSEGETSVERGGRPRRYVRVTPEGQAQLSHSRNALIALWEGLEGVLDR
jgi:PadR family transcriptional regulator PadR